MIAISAEEAGLTGITRYSPPAYPFLAGNQRLLTESFLLGILQSWGRGDLSGFLWGKKIKSQKASPWEIAGMCQGSQKIASSPLVTNDLS